MTSNERKGVDHREGGTDGLLRHPLSIATTTLLLGTILTYFVAPKVTYYRTLQEKRLEKALDFVAHNEDVDQHLNILLTTLALFHNDNSGVKAHLVDYRKEQDTLRQTMKQKYLEFDSTAWWWYRKVRAEAKVLRLTSKSEYKEIDGLISSYDSNLVESTKVLTVLWDKFLAAEYRPDDSSNNAAIKETRQKLDALRNSREEIVIKVSGVFVGNR